MNIANMLARLNPKNVRFDVGAGGTPDIMSPEVAGAIAFVEPGVGRELLMLKYWPDGAKRTLHQLHGAIDRLLRTEWGKRETVMTEGLMAILDHGSKAQIQYQAAHAQRWPVLVKRNEAGEPELTEGYVKVRNGVLHELAQAGQCQACLGRTEVRNAFGAAMKCTACLGVGQLRMGERERAEAAGFAWSTYRSLWSSVYDWAYQACAEELYRAERQFAYALSDPE